MYPQQVVTYDDSFLSSSKEMPVFLLGKPTTGGGGKFHSRLLF